MGIIHATSRKRETYDVQVTYSPLWECALGIAAITNTPIIDTLEKSSTYWDELKRKLSKKLISHLDYVEKNNTWKALLQLLHQNKGDNLNGFCSKIKELEATDLKFYCLPFIGDQYQDLRKRAALGEEAAISELKKLTHENPFFPQYIEFISNADIVELKNHLIEVMSEWYETVIIPDIKEIEQILQVDSESKDHMRGKLSPQELVQWATGGVNYLPEPGVHKVLLIPQYIYRPWNIEADLEKTKVFYYPVANESLSPDDKYTPNHFLVQKYKAFGDETRLKIVKLLSERDHSLQSLTEYLNVGKTTVHHHLKILRAAKIIEMENMKYILNGNALNILHNELERYIKR